MSDLIPLYRHPQPHRELARRWQSVARQPGFFTSLIVSTLFLMVGWFVNYFSIEFATDRASNSVTDIVLSNIPVFEVDALFVYGTFVFALLSFTTVLFHPKRIPFAFKAVALFCIIRSIFASLTHIAPFEASYMSDFGPTINSMF